MLVQAQAGEAQAARGFWGAQAKKSRKLLVPAGGEQHRQQVGLKEVLEERKISYMMLIVLLIMILRLLWQRLLRHGLFTLFCLLLVTNTRSTCT
jgi:hypothetical protein